jgi:hypothetical protein
MDTATRRCERGNPMSRYLATMILALAAAIITVADLALTIDQPDGARGALMVRP